MSIAVVKNQINAFLATEKPEVIAIKGAWGVGKTYRWKQFLPAACQTVKRDIRRYMKIINWRCFDTSRLAAGLFICLPILKALENVDTSNKDVQP